MNPRPSDVQLTDRTTIETDWTCGQKRWLYKHEGGGGIVPVQEAIALKDGIDLHKDLAAINLGKPWQEVADGLNEVAPSTTDPMPLRERWLRRVGWVTAYGRWVHPILRDKFETVRVEDEMVLTRGKLWVALTADWVVRSRETKRLVVFDYKSVGMLGKSWVVHWPYAIQMHLNILGVQEELGEAVEYAQIIGARKGEDDQGKLRHPYVWAYSDGGDAPASWQLEWKKGWILRSVAEYPGGPDAWIERLGPEVGLAQFPFSTPVTLDQRMVDILLRQRAARELEVANVLKLCHDDPIAREIYFEHRFSHCRPSWGLDTTECPYLRACHNAEVAADPLGSGLYVPRTPHHDLERIGVADEDV